MSAAADGIDANAVPGNAAVYRRLLGYSARYWPTAILAMIGMVFDAACGAAFTFQIKPMLDGLFRDKDPATIFWMPLIIVASVPGAWRGDLSCRFRHGAHRARRGDDAARRCVPQISVSACRAFQPRVLGPAHFAHDVHSRAGRQREHRCAQGHDSRRPADRRSGLRDADGQRTPDDGPVPAGADDRRRGVRGRPALSAHQ